LVGCLEGDGLSMLAIGFSLYHDFALSRTLITERHGRAQHVSEGPKLGL